MKLDSACLELVHHALDPPLNRRMVRSVAGDKLLDDGLQCCGRQQRVGYVHRVSLLVQNAIDHAAAIAEKRIADRKSVEFCLNGSS